MRAVLAALSVFALASPALADDGPYANRGFLDFSPPPQGYVGGLGLVTLLGPTGLFQNATSGILPKNAFSVESCMAFRENNGDHFQANGVLATYGVTDWMEIGGYGLFVHGLDPFANGDDSLQSGQLNGRIRLMRDEGVMPEISVGALGAWGDDPLEFYSLYVSGSKGMFLSDGPFMRSVRLHFGFRQEWPKLGQDVSTGFAGLELEVFKSLYLVGEVNTKDDSYNSTPWSFGFQYRGSSFGLTAAVVQTPSDDHKTAYVGIGVSY